MDKINVKAFVWAQVMKVSRQPLSAEIDLKLRLDDMDIDSLRLITMVAAIERDLGMSLADLGDTVALPTTVGDVVALFESVPR